jgi:hypothetical protein
MKRKLMALTCIASMVLVLVVTAGASVVSPSPTTKMSTPAVVPVSLSTAMLGSLRGGWFGGNTSCQVMMVGVGLGLLAGAVATGGIALALAGAYAPLLAAVC